MFCVHCFLDSVMSGIQWPCIPGIVSNIFRSLFTNVIFTFLTFCKILFKHFTSVSIFTLYDANQPTVHLLELRKWVC